MEPAQTEAMILELEGTRAAVIVSAAEYDRLLASAEEIDEAGSSIFWDQVRLDLGSM